MSIKNNIFAHYMQVVVWARFPAAVREMSPHSSPEKTLFGEKQRSDSRAERRKSSLRAILLWQKSPPSSCSLSSSPLDSFFAPPSSLPVSLIQDGGLASELFSARTPQIRLRCRLKNTHFQHPDSTIIIL